MVNKDASIIAQALSKAILKPGDTPECAWATYEWLYEAAAMHQGGSHFSSKQLKTKYYNGLKKAAADDDAGLARELWDELNQEQQLEIWGAYGPESGVRSTIKSLLASTGEHNGLST